MAAFIACDTRSEGGDVSPNLGSSSSGRSCPQDDAMKGLYSYWVRVTGSMGGGQELSEGGGAANWSGFFTENT